MHAPQPRMPIPLGGIAPEPLAQRRSVHNRRFAWAHGVLLVSLILVVCGSAMDFARLDLGAAGVRSVSAWFGPDGNLWRLSWVLVMALIALGAGGLRVLNALRHDSSSSPDEPYARMLWICEAAGSAGAFVCWLLSVWSLWRLGMVQSLAIQRGLVVVGASAAIAVVSTLVLVGQSARVSVPRAVGAVG